MGIRAWAAAAALSACVWAGSATAEVNNEPIPKDPNGNYYIIIDYYAVVRNFVNYYRNGEFYDIQDYYIYDGPKSAVFQFHVDNYVNSTSISKANVSADDFVELTITGFDKSALPDILYLFGDKIEPIPVQYYSLPGRYSVLKKTVYFDDDYPGEEFRTFGFRTYSDDVFGVGVGPISFPAPVPEPSTWAMMLIGFAGLGYAGYRKRREVAATA